MIIPLKGKIHNPNLPINDRPILTSSTALGILRHQLAENIGVDRLRGFLFRFGWEMGVNDARKAMETSFATEFLIKNGPKLHGDKGHFLASEYEGHVELEENQNVVSVYGTGTWVNSYEAIEHLSRIGLSTYTVCHTLVGYSSGFMSTVCGQKVLIKEVTCVGKGDAECRWVLKTQQEWQNENPDELEYVNEQPIVKELEYTYEQLIEQKEFIMRLADFQKRLTEEIANGCDVQTLATIVNELTQFPVVIDDIDFETIGYSGLSEPLFTQLRDDINNYIQEHESISRMGWREKQQLPFRQKTIKTDWQERLITPIIVQKQVVGYCAFIIDTNKKRFTDDDFFFLERFANAISLILLNEKTKFDYLERMKGSFLEQILDGQLPVEELVERGKFTGINLEKPYYLVAIEYDQLKLSLEEEFHFQERIVETTFHYFDGKRQRVLVSQRNGKIILFISLETGNIDQLIDEFHRLIFRKFPEGNFKMGISSRGDDVEAIQEYYEEANMALRLNNKKKIVFFETLGIIGAMINSYNKPKIYKMAKKELGVLYDTTDPKTIEHLKTLYYFLFNGGNLEQTMSELALSMSGLRYRLKRIEELLEKDIRDPNQAHQLLTIIISLIALGELSIE